ncbi:hypothetical protein R1flu_019639 [Riccia fluitans]|uniref:Uncharacterized protein n=1 Tax=Riccia fluitans TaxID=41844 RepID=A0ABD1ZJ79_9MARC
MAPRSSRNLKTKEVKIPHLIVANRKKMESWGLGGLFVVDWSGTYNNLLEELTTKQKAAGPKFKYQGKPEEWTSEVWREVYNLSKASLGGYIMKGKVQFIQLQLLRKVKEDRWLSKSGVFLEQVEVNSDFVLFCQMLNTIFAPADKRFGSLQRGNLPRPVLAHLYIHFHEMDAKEKEASKKHKASIQTISDFDTETKPEDEKKPPKEVPRVFCHGEASGSKLLDQKLDFAEWGNHVGSLAVRLLGFLRCFM